MTTITEITAASPTPAARKLEAAAASVRAAQTGEASALARPGAAPNSAEDAAKGFEAVFLTQLVDSMFAGLETSGYFGGGNAEKLWRGFLVEHIAEAFAEQGGVGIADAVRAQIIQLSERP